MYPVVYEELHSYYEEEYYACKDVSEGFIKPEGGGDLAGSLTQHYYQQGAETHYQHIELCQPCNHDPREAVSACQTCGYGVVCSETIIHPANPQRAPDSTRVLTITLSTLIPT